MLLVLAGAAGCRRTTTVEATVDAAWVGPGVRVVGRGERVGARGLWPDASSSLIWHDPTRRERTWNAAGVVGRCIDFATSRGMSVEPLLDRPIAFELVPAPFDAAYRSRRRPDDPYRPEGWRRSRDDDGTIRREPRLVEGLLWPRSHHLVSLDPIVVIVVDRPVWTAEPRDPDARLSLPYAEDGSEVDVRLGGGFVHGTRFAGAERVLWYSPSLDAAPRAVEWADDRAVILVPWGELRLRREGDEIVVDATRSRSTRGPAAIARADRRP